MMKQSKNAFVKSGDVEGMPLEGFNSLQQQLGQQIAGLSQVNAMATIDIFALTSSKMAINWLLLAITGKLRPITVASSAIAIRQPKCQSMRQMCIARMPLENL